MDLDRVTALSEDRERLWSQLTAADFLSADEKREAVGLVPRGPVSSGETGPVEMKFNPWHDPQDGRFTSSGSGVREGGGSFGGGGATGRGNWGLPGARNTIRKPASAPSRTPTAVPAVEKPSAATASNPGTTRVEAQSPRRVVIAGGYRFEADARGRAAHISGALRLQPSQRRSRRNQDEAGKPNRMGGDHGGHFIAREFGGPEIALNHFAQDGRVNRSEYRKIELIWKANLKSARKVSVSITPSYDRDSKRPKSLDVKYFVNGDYFERSVTNSPGGK